MRDTLSNEQELTRRRIWVRSFQALREQDVQKPAGFRVQDAFLQIGNISFWLEVCVCVCVFVCVCWGGGDGAGSAGLGAQGRI